MSEQCNQSCSECGENCASRKPESFQAAANAGSRVKRVIGVASGKGGVGKSLVTSLLAVQMQRQGYNAAVLDADITGPSVPKAFGLTEKPRGNEDGVMLPVSSITGVKVMSLNLLLEEDTDPVIWRGPVIAGTVKQFWTDVAWGDVDYMFVDLPPGTGDVPLTVYQSLPLDGIVIVTTPQELVSMIVGKAAKMAQMMNVPVLGLVENMSYIVCPDCGKRTHVFGESRLEETAKTYGISMTEALPLSQNFAALCDAGQIEYCPENLLLGLIEALQG